MKRVTTFLAQNLKYAELLLEMDEACDGPIPGITLATKLDHVRALRASVCIVTIASFECFLRDVCGAYVEHINSAKAQPAWGTLPQQLKNTHIFKSPYPKMDSRRPGESNAAFETRILLEVADVASNISSPCTGGRYKLILYGFLETNSNPDAKNTKGMFRNIGIPDVLAHPYLLRVLSQFDPAIADQKSYELQLDDLAQRRHSVAHGRFDAISHLSRDDLQYGINFIRQSGRAFQHIAGTAVRQL